MNSRKRLFIYFVLLASLVWAFTTAAAPWTESTSSSGPEQILGHVVDTTNILPGVATTFFRLQIDEYNHAGDVSEMIGLLANKGQDALRASLESKEVGRIQLGLNNLSYPVAMARNVPYDGGTILRAVIARPIGFVEQTENWRRADYPFTVVEIYLGEDGRGSGALTLATKLEFDEKDNTLIVESYDFAPMQIMDARTVTSSAK